MVARMRQQTGSRRGRHEQRSVINFNPGNSIFVPLLPFAALREMYNKKARVQNPRLIIL